MLDTFSDYLYAIVWCPAFGLFNISGFILEIIGLWDSVGADFKV